MKVLLGERMVTLEEAALKLNIHEVGGDNRGPWMKKFLAEVGLPEGYAWCDAAQSYYEHQSAGHHVVVESASVLQTWDTALKLGWVVARPSRGCLVLYDWTAPGPPFRDHIGLVVSAADLGWAWKLNTIEGNTSSGNAGSQGNGDDLYARTRVISKGYVGFVRIPLQVDLQPVAHVTPSPHGGLPGRKITPKPAPEPISEHGKGQNEVGKGPERVVEKKTAIAKSTTTKSGSTKKSAPAKPKAAAKKKTAAPKATAKKTTAKKTAAPARRPSQANGNVRKPGPQQ